MITGTSRSDMSDFMLIKHRQAIHFGHLDVEQHEIERLRAQLLAGPPGRSRPM